MKWHIRELKLESGVWSAFVWEPGGVPGNGDIAEIYGDSREQAVERAELLIQANETAETMKAVRPKS